MPTVQPTQPEPYQTKSDKLLLKTKSLNEQAQPQITPISTKRKSLVSVISEVFVPTPKLTRTPTPITTPPTPPPITTTAPRENTVLETEKPLIQLVGNAITTQGKTESKPSFLTAVNQNPVSVSTHIPYEGVGQIIGGPHPKEGTNAQTNAAQAAEQRFNKNNTVKIPKVNSSQVFNQYGVSELKKIAYENGLTFPKDVDKRIKGDVIKYMSSNLAGKNIILSKHNKLKKTKK